MPTTALTKKLLTEAHESALSDNVTILLLRIPKYPTHYLQPTTNFSSFHCSAQKKQIITTEVTKGILIMMSRQLRGIMMLI